MKDDQSSLGMSFAAPPGEVKVATSSVFAHVTAELDVYGILQLFKPLVFKRGSLQSHASCKKLVKHQGNYGILVC